MKKDWNEKFIKEKCYSIDNDRFKEKTYIYAPFPEANQHGFQNGNIRHLLLGDIMSRYLRMQNYNVLYPTGFNSISMASFQESKKLYKVLDDQNTDIFYHQMSDLGIGINDAKCINMRHHEYISILQNAFIELYERNYIRYKIASPYYDKDSNLIYDYMELDEVLPKMSQKCFVLSVAGILPQVVSDIKNLPILEEYKNALIEKLDPVSVLSLEIHLSNGKTLEIELEEPEYLGGISYIFLNPTYMDISDYISKDEYGSVVSYMHEEKGLYVYSGLLATNPLTGNEIPVFISVLYPVDIYLGIPDIDEEANLLASNEGFDILPILSDGILINSDILDGYTKEEARKKIIEAFSDAEIAKVSYSYRNSEILMSKNEPFGALLPFLEDKGKLNSLKDYLPYNFSSQFRPVLGDDVLVSGLPMQGTMSPLFTLGMCPILSIIYDNIGSIESIFSDDTKELYREWLPIRNCYIPKDSMVTDILMPLIFYNIIKKEVSYELPNLFSNVVIINRSLDVHHKSIKRSHNNLMDMDKWILKYGIDAIRCLALSEKASDEMIYDPYILEDIVSEIEQMKTSILSAIDEKRPHLDYFFHQLAMYLKNAFDQGDILGCLDILRKFNHNILFHEIISKDQAYLYLRIIYPIYPYLSEELYSEMFNGKYSILNEGWPVE